MAEKNEIFEIIKSVITSQKGGVLLKDINRDYRNLAGEHIPYKSLGYQSIEEVMDDIPEVHSYVNSDGQLVFINEGKNCEHLVELISKQRSTKSNKVKLCNKGFRQKAGIPRQSAVCEIVQQYPFRVSERQYSANLHSDSYESLHNGRIMRERNEYSLEKDYNTVYMMKRIVDKRTDLREKKYTKDTEKIYNVNLKQKNTSYSKKSSDHSFADFSGHRGKEWKPYESHCDRSSHFECWQEDSYQEKLPFYEGDMHYDMTNYYSSSGHFNRGEKNSSSKSKSFKLRRANPPEDYPNPLYRDNAFDSPVARNHFKFSKNPKYRSNGGSRYVPEIDDWDVTNHDYENDGRSEMDGGSWMEGDDVYGHSGRKIDVISGSLRVTIKNC